MNSPLQAPSSKLTAAPGLLISFDGVDSSGKETQVKKLVARLQRLGIPVVQFETPDYTTATGKELRLRLQHKVGDWVHTPWEQKMKLFAANRAAHRDEVIAALAQGNVVIYDRYVPSSLTFMVVEALGPQAVDLWRDKIQRVVERQEYTVNRMPREDLSIFLDVPPEISEALLRHRKATLNHNDEYTDHLEVQKRLYNEYDVLCQRDARRFMRIRCVVGEELLGIDEVAELVWNGVREAFPSLRVHHRV